MRVGEVNFEFSDDERREKVGELYKTVSNFPIMLIGGVRNN